MIEINGNSKIALFDFCETLVSFQTADEYVKYVLNKTGYARHKSTEVYRQVLHKTRLIKVINKFYKKSYINKQLLLRQLSGLQYVELDKLAKKYYEDMIIPNFITDVLNELVELKRKGYRIILVSAGYDIYLKYFSEEYGIDMCLATQLEFDNGLCTGRYNGSDCIGTEKINKLTKLLGYADLKCIDSIAYSDSRSDISLLNYAKKAVVVSKGKSQSWAKEKAYEEIIWE